MNYNQLEKMKTEQELMLISMLERKDNKIRELEGIIKRLSSSSGKFSEEDLDMFDEARRMYPGTKRGAKTEMANFVKKHNDWSIVLPTLYDTIAKQISSRRSRELNGYFVPEWKNFMTWINQRCWEEE